MILQVILVVTLTATHTQATDWEDFVRPGALIENLGTIYPITEHINIKIGTNAIASLKSRVLNQQMIAKRLNTSLAKMNLTKDLRAPLQHLMQASLHSLNAAISPPPSINTIRQKRGLFNAGGVFANFLFGIATDDTVNSRFKQQEQTLSSAVSTFHTVIDSFTTMNDRLHLLLTTSNTLSDSLKHLERNTQDLRHFTLVSSSLTLFNTQAQRLLNDLEHLTQDFVLAAHGEIMPSLLPEKTLLRILELFTANSYRRPLFDTTQLHLYYPYLTAILHPQELNVLVPLLPQTVYHGSRIHAFPSEHDNTFITVALTHDIVLRSSSGNAISTISSSALQDCTKALPNMTVCLDLSLPEFPYLTPSCTKSLISNELVNNTCTFNQIILTNPYYVYFSHLQFIFFPKLTPLVVSCNGTHSDLTIKGPLVISTSCSLHSNLIILKAHNTFISHHTPRFNTITNYSLPSSNIHTSIVHSKIRFLPSNLTNISWTPSPHVIYTFPTSLMIITIIIIVSGFLVLRWRAMRNITQQAPQSITQDDHETPH